MSAFLLSSLPQKPKLTRVALSFSRPPVSKHKQRHTHTQYDLSATTYSPDGKVFQTDYAQKAVDNSRCVIRGRGGKRARAADAADAFDRVPCSHAAPPAPPPPIPQPPKTQKNSTAIGLRCKDGVVLAVEKPILSKLLVEGSGRRTFFLDHHAGAAVAGLLPDGRVIASRACDEAASYKAFYGEPIPGETLCERLGSYMHLFNLYWSMRPFGACFLLASYDEGAGSEPQLALVEPSGVAMRYHGAAVGKGRQAAKNEIEKLKLSEMGSREAVMQAARM